MMAGCTREDHPVLRRPGGRTMMAAGAGLMMAGTGFPASHGPGRRITTVGGTMMISMDGCGSPDTTGRRRGLNGAMVEVS